MTQAIDRTNVSPTYSVRPALLRAKVVLKFLFREVYAKSYLSISWIAICGVTARLMRLFALVAALKAIFVTINLQKFAEALQLQADAYGFGIMVTSETVILLIVSILALLHLLVFVASSLRFRGVRALQEAYINAQKDSAKEVDLKVDCFVIEKFCPAVDISISLIEIAMFLFILILFVALISPQTVLFLLPFIALIAGIVLFAGRRRLRLIEQRRKARQAYTRGHAASINDRELFDTWLSETRPDYIKTIREWRSQQQATQQLTGLLMGAAIIAVLVYISAIGLDSSTLLTVSFPIIFVVLALRQIMIAANEFGRHLSLLLELRNEAAVVERLTDPPPEDA